MGRLILGPAALLLLAAVATPVRACINDREVERAEREFKSQYLELAPASEPLSPSPGQMMPIALLGGGAVMLVGATLTIVKPRGRPQPD
jgi:hypothetical protein